MTRLLIVAALLALVVTGCVTSSPSTTSVDVATTSTSTATVPSSQDRIAVSSVDGGVRVHDATGAEVMRLDAAVGTSYRQPVWASDGSILAARSGEGGGAGLVSVDASDASIRWEAAMDTPPFYYLPAPAGSGWATTSLRNDPSGEGLIAELVDGDGMVTPIATISPFYSTWSPDGGQLAVHGGGRTIDIRSEGGTETIADPSGVFQAPVWTADGLVTLRTTAIGQVLSVWDGVGFEDVASVSGPVRFTAESGRVALQAVGSGGGGGVQAGFRSQQLPEIPAGRLVVVDLDSGAIETVINELTPFFQWDPSGERLLFATFTSPDTLTFRVQVWEGGSTLDLGSFDAQPIWFRDLVPFFDQYDQSISLWSTGGDAIAIPEVLDGRRVVSIRPLDGSRAVVIEDATWVTWSPPDVR
jgi:hypothetical protein